MRWCRNPDCPQALGAEAAVECVCGWTIARHVDELPAEHPVRRYYEDPPTERREVAGTLTDTPLRGKGKAIHFGMRLRDDDGSEYVGTLPASVYKGNTPQHLIGGTVTLEADVTPLRPGLYGLRRPKGARIEERGDGSNG